jgi:hypothetical protein
MSVTSPTLKLLALDEPERAVLLDPPAAAPPAELLLLLLLPHAASPRASATVAIARRPTGLILPVTRVSFPTRPNGQPYSVRRTAGELA